MTRHAGMAVGSKWLSLVLAGLVSLASGTVYGNSPDVLPRTGDGLKGSSYTATQLVGQRFTAYSPTFAKRFGLDLAAATDLDPRLLAIEIGVESGVSTSPIRCYVAMYVASDAVDNESFGDEASANLLEVDRHFFLQPRANGVDPRQVMSREDSKHLLSRQAKYFRRITFSTGDYLRRSAGAGSDSKAISEQVNQLFPGINYIRTLGCMAAQMINHGAGVEVGIRRRGAPDYSRISGPLRDEDLIRIPLPKGLLDSSLPMLELYQKYARQLTEEQAQKRRDSFDKRTK